MHTLRKAGGRQERSSPAGVPLLPVEPPGASSERSAKTNIALAVALILFVSVVVFAGGEELTTAISASGAFVYASFQQLTGKLVAEPPFNGTKPAAAPSGKAALPVPESKPAVKTDKKPADSQKKEKQNKEGKKEEKQLKDGKPQEKGSRTMLITTVQHKGKELQILNEPIPPECHAEAALDLDGFAVQWGLGHKAHSAAECCRLCQDFKKNNPTSQQPCNAWVWCGDKSGECWTMDIHSHTTGDCWLKYQEQWDNNPDLSKSNLKVNHRGNFSAEFRREHKTAPLRVPWVAGVIPAKQG